MVPFLVLFSLPIYGQKDGTHASRKGLMVIPYLILLVHIQRTKVSLDVVSQAHMHKNLLGLMILSF